MIYDFKKKEHNVSVANRQLLNKTLSMFEYNGLPDTIPAKELEKLLQMNGYAFITEVDGELYAFSGGLGGVGDVYGNPTEIIISNPALNFNKSLSIKDDGVLIANDDMMTGLIPLFTKYNTLLVENDINMVLNGYSNRMNILLSASDDKTKASAESYISKIVKGDISIIGENAMWEGVKSHSMNSQGAKITDLIEYHQYIKGSLLNEIGLPANFNMKRERLVSAEVEQGNDGLLAFVYNMILNRTLAINKINEKYNLNIVIDFGSVWNFINKKFADGVVESDGVIESLNDEVPVDPVEATVEAVVEAVDEAVEATDEAVDEVIDEAVDPVEDDPVIELPVINDEPDNDDVVEVLGEVINDANIIDDIVDVIDTDDIVIVDGVIEGEENVTE